LEMPPPTPLGAELLLKVMFATFSVAPLLLRMPPPLVPRELLWFEAFPLLTIMPDLTAYHFWGAVSHLNLLR
jgi:hypothetical protein